MKFSGIVLLIAVCAMAAPPPVPVLTSVYHVGDLGLIDFTMADGKAVGRYKAGGVCELAPDSHVVTGAFEGNVFIGSVTVCQEGAGCDKTRAYPLLAVWHDDELLGTLRLPPGCSSPALDRGQLFFRPATVEEKRTVLEGSASSAALLASKNAKKDPAQQLRDLMKVGEAQLDSHDYRGARSAFEAALELQGDYWPARYGLGVAQVKLKDPARGLETLDAARLLAQRSGSPTDVALIQFNIACAWAQQGKKNEAPTALRSAVRSDGAAVFDYLSTDSDLASLRADTDFKRVVDQARVAKDKARKPR